MAAGAADYAASEASFALVRYRGTYTCRVPDVRGRRLRAAKRMIVGAHCSLGRVARAFSNSVRKGRVISQRPAPGALRAEHTRVRLVVSKGPSR